MTVRFKGAHFPPEVILPCVRWYVAYPPELPACRGTHGRAWRVGRPRNGEPLGDQGLIPKTRAFRILLTTRSFHMYRKRL